MRLFAALLLCAANAWATTYYASPDGGAAASCVDNGANVCTLARAEAVATHGDTIIAACGTYALGGTALTVNVNATVQAVTDRCATVTGSNATAVVILAAANDAATLTWDGINVWPDDNDLSASSRAISLSALSGYDATIVIRDATLYSGANSAVNDATLRGTTRIWDVVAAGNMGAQGWITAQNQASVAAKKIEVDGCTGSLTATASNTPAVTITRSTTTPQDMFARIVDCDVSVTVPASLGASALGRGLNISNVTSGTDFDGATTCPSIEDSTVSVSSVAATSADTLGITLTATNSGAVGDCGKILNNIVTCNSPAAHCISIGDGSTQSYVDQAQVYGNTVTNAYYDGVATPHGIRIGRVVGGRAWGNMVQGGAVGILTSINQGALISGNIVRGAYYAPLFSKGSGGTTAPQFVNNSVLIDDRFYGVRIGAYGCMSAAVQGATNNAAADFKNNACKVASGSGWKYVVVDASQTATFSTNNYYADITLTDPWSYQGSASANLAAWQTAQEATATSIDPKWIGGTSPDSASEFRLTAASALRRVGLDLNIGHFQDYDNRAFQHPPSVGAWEVADGDATLVRTTAALRTTAVARATAAVRAAR
jgi:hypothetical protein